MIAMLALSLAACDEPQPAGNTPNAGAAAAAAQPETLRLYALDCGRADLLNLGWFDRGGAYDGRQYTADVPCFLIRHPAGDLLWDTGLPDALNDEPDGLLRNEIRFSVPKTVRSQLTELGLGAVDIEYLSLSHSHFDHSGNANAFAAATWLVDDAERAYMFGDEARANPESFAPYSALEHANTVTFSADYDVFGDGSVTIVRTPGHTPGHTSLLVRLRRSGPVLLSGDLYHLAEARERRTVPVFNTDADETLRSMDKFEALAASTGARVVIQHDAGHFRALPVFPAFLD
jgi:glyoxylase-like metal-dependent hydrolase (beta-lactamase superfamily II)